MHIVASQILKSVDFTETQKSRNLKSKTLTFFKGHLHIKGHFIAKTSFVEVAMNNIFSNMVSD